MNESTCTTERCASAVLARGLCRKHYTEDRYNNPAPLRDVIKDLVGYSALHKRIQRIRGYASNHPCLICGARGAEWSLGDDAAELHYENGQPAYSLEVSNYDSLCIDCHKTRDRESREQARRVKEILDWVAQQEAHSTAT